MWYLGTDVTECFYMQDKNGHVHAIEMTKNGFNSTFSVYCSCDEDWGYEFSNMDVTSDYERVKHIVVEAAFACADIFEAMNAIDDAFEHVFGDIMFDEDECGCGCETVTDNGCANGANGTNHGCCNHTNCGSGCAYPNCGCGCGTNCNGNCGANCTGGCGANGNNGCAVNPNNCGINCGICDD